MKMTRCLALLSFLTVGCGNSDGNGGDGGADTALQCNAVGWCTSWGADSSQVTNAPALNGGTIREGMYRLEQGHFGAQAMVFQGTSFLSVGSSWRNSLGTWTASGGTLKTTLAKSCDSEGDGTLSSTYSHAFAVRGAVSGTAPAPRW